MGKVLAALTLLLVCAAAVIWIRTGHSTASVETSGCGSSPTAAIASEQPSAVDTTQIQNGGIVVAYYFFTTQRCANCYKIETYTREVVESRFARNIADGHLVWRMINTDLEENDHFIQDYSLFTKSVVLVQVEDGKTVHWKNLDKIWSLLRDKEKFQSYIESELKQFLGA